MQNRTGPSPEIRPGRHGSAARAPPPATNLATCRHSRRVDTPFNSRCRQAEPAEASRRAILVRLWPGLADTLELDLDDASPSRRRNADSRVDLLGMGRVSMAILEVAVPDQELGPCRCGFRRAVPGPIAGRIPAIYARAGRASEQDGRDLAKVVVDRYGSTCLTRRTPPGAEMFTKSLSIYRRSTPQPRRRAGFRRTAWRQMSAPMRSLLERAACRQETETSTDTLTPNKF